MPCLGDTALSLVNELMDLGVNHVVLLMRHSAREFVEGRHDLDNPLTDEGRHLATRFGQKLPKNFLLRAYASPVERCMETARIILDAHKEQGGSSTRLRPVEALGVFYVLDQQKMFRSMQAHAASGSRFLEHWYAGNLDADIMMPADLAAQTVATVAITKFQQRVAEHQLDILVSHDMTLYTLRNQLLRQSYEALGEVNFLDAIAFYQLGEKTYIRSHHGDGILLNHQS
jgi:broad specificity phosphatase PhoE